MKISVLIFLGFAAILAMFTFTTFVNYQQSQSVSEDAEWVATSQQIIRNASRLQRNIVEMQSNLRGYLLTGESLFLDPYRYATQENTELIRELNALIPSATQQKKKLAQIEQLYHLWENEFAYPLIEAKQRAHLSDSSHKVFEQLYHSQLSKRLDQSVSEQIRDHFKDFTNYVYTLRAERRATLKASVANTRLLSISLTSASIVIGLVIAIYITRVITNRIQHMVNLAERVAEGNFTTPVEDKARDELGHLARSLNHMARILDENFRELEQKNTELDRFAYVVSHDLKAPLRGIENLAGWLEEDFGEELPVKAQEYLQLMKGRVNRMESLIDGILEVSRIGKGKKTVETVDVYHLVRESIEMLSPGLRLKFHVQPDLPVIQTERIPLQQVLTNLISNAIKYHDREDGNVYVRGRDAGTHYEFVVRDDGPGIDPRFHEKIFIIFQTLQARDTLESTGVGLAIVKKILDDKKCRIQVISDVGKGATFIFTWPKITNVSSLPGQETIIPASRTHEPGRSIA